jgi:serine/threonine protein phosphatase PrpC
MQMIYKYGIRIRGVSHEQDNTPCQDAYKISRCSDSDSIVIAAVADGLGTSEHSDVASQTAVEMSVKYCAEKLKQTDNVNDTLKIIRESFKAARNAIEEKAEETDNGELFQYYTTLSLAVLSHNTLYYGHSGDSGIIVLTDEGLFEEVTEQQQDEDGHVFPLHFENKWVFKRFDKKVCSVLLATDGILYRLCPPLLKNENVSIYINFARRLMDNQYLDIKEQEEKVEKKIEGYIKSISDKSRADFNSDDLTLVVLVNTSVKPETQPEDYYKEPDWSEMRRKLKEKHEKEQRARYPHLFKDDKTDKITENKTDVPNSGIYGISEKPGESTAHKKKSVTDTAKDTSSDIETKSSKKESRKFWKFWKDFFMNFTKYQ